MYVTTNIISQTMRI